MKTNKSLPYLFIAPALLLFALFTIYPIFSSFILSFQSMEGGKYVFTGLSNYTRLLGDDIFWKALGQENYIAKVRNGYRDNLITTSSLFPPFHTILTGVIDNSTNPSNSRTSLKIGISELLFFISLTNQVPKASLFAFV